MEEEWEEGIEREKSGRKEWRGITGHMQAGVG
jgi:hypothetical protein